MTKIKMTKMTVTTVTMTVSQHKMTRIKMITQWLYCIEMTVTMTVNHFFGDYG